jgi:hypothetical protein
LKNKSSKLLLDEFPLIILPQLAVKIGLNEAIILQQVNYWVVQCGKEKDGREWVFNTYPDWQKQFPFFSLSTIKRTILSLEKKNLLITGNYNRLKIDKTKWYSINHDALNALETPLVQNDTTDKTPLAQNGLSSDSKCTIEQTNMSRPLPKTTSKTNKEINKDKASSLPTDGIYKPVDNFTKDALTVYVHFMRSYTNHKGEVHPIISNKVVDKLNSIMEDETIYDPDMDKDLFIDVEAMCTMIDKYFVTEYPLTNGGQADHRIYHFLSDMVMKNLYYKECY